MSATQMEVIKVDNSLVNKRIGIIKGKQIFADGYNFDEDNEEIAKIFGEIDENARMENTVSSVRKHPERKLGIMNSSFTMSEDFDETPDCFKPYM